MNLFLGVILLFSTDISQLKKADELYRNGKYEDALSIYQAQLNEDPSNYSIAFNIGNTLFKLGKFDDAKKAYQRAESLTQSAEKSANSFYNKSLAGIKSQQIEEAMKDLKTAIKLNPDDKDARANFEIVSRLLDKKKQEEKKQDQKQNKDQKNKDDKNQQDKNQQDKNKQDQKNQDKKDQEQKDKQQQNQQNKEDQQQPDQKKKQQQVAKISPEQAQRLLDAMKKNEKEQLLKKADFQKRTERRKSDKDW